MLNLACILEDSARRYPTSPAFTFGETTLNYAQINGAANQIANGLKSKGIKRGDKVAIDCLNLPYFQMILECFWYLFFYDLSVSQQIFF